MRNVAAFPCSARILKREMLLNWLRVYEALKPVDGITTPDRVMPPPKVANGCVSGEFTDCESSAAAPARVVESSPLAASCWKSALPCVDCRTLFISVSTLNTENWVG